jgi:hypothetical protein
MLAIFLSRKQGAAAAALWWRAGVALLAAGSAGTLLVIALLVPLGLPLEVLGAGPAVVTAGLLACLAGPDTGRRRDAAGGEGAE